MRIVIALGGNALLRRSDSMTTEVQRRNIKIAAQAIAPLAAEHSVVIAHGNGPQVGLLSLQAEAYDGAEPYPLDVLDAGTQGMIGYLIQQELRSVLPELQVATLLTMIVVDPQDPAFADPTKFVGPIYAKDDADKLAADKGWAFRQDGPAWRRVVPSPEPRRILEIEPITWLLDQGAVVICAGGGGIPTMYPSSAPGELVGVAGYEFASGSMGPKVEAAAVSPRKPAGAPRSAPLLTLPGSSREMRAPAWFWRRHPALRSGPGPLWGRPGEGPSLLQCCVQ
jgi:carbamate kinase